MMRALSRAVLPLVLVFAGCAQHEQPNKDISGCPDKAAQVVDASLLAYLSKARSVHLRADLAESDNHPDEAIALLEKLVASPAPGGSKPPPEVREVLADTLARLAELKKAKKDLDAAKSDLKKGLDLALERTHFRGRLFEVLGGVEMAHYKDLKAKGDEPGARAAKDRSEAALEEAIAIQEEVIQRALGD
jgi:tetratricopeptide (TPR) repeat protein